MGYLDFSQPDVPDLTGGLSAIGDALTKVMQRRQQRQEQDQKLAFEREQEQRRYAQQQGQFDYQNRIEDRKAKIAELEFNQKQQAHQAQMAEAVRKAIAENNPQRAAQIAAETATYDPHTGQEIGRGSLTQGPMRDVGKPPPMPMSSDDIPSADQTAALRAVPGMPAAPFNAIDQERKDAEGNFKRFEAQSEAYSQDLKNAEAERPQILKFGPKDPGITFDMATQRHATRDAAAQDFIESFRGVPMSQSDQVAAQNVYAQIKAGALDPAKAGAAYDKARFGVVQEEGKNTRSAGRDKAIVDAAKARATGDIGWARLHSTEDKDRRKETRGDIKDWLKANGLESAPKQVAAMDLSARQLDSTDGRQQQAALVGMARSVQGDNRFSDQDYRVFVANGGVGALDQAAGTIQQIIDGEFGDETIAAAKRMNGALRAVFSDRVKRAGTEGSEQYVNDPETYDPRVARHVLEQRLGKENLPAIGGPPEVRAKAKAKAKAKAAKPSSLDEAMQ